MTVTLVLLPGMDGTGTLFEHFIAALGPEFPVKVVRYPVSEPLGYTELENLVRSELPSSTPFVIIGESFSGPIAVSIASSCLPNLKGLVLCCSFVRNPRPAFSILRPFLPVVPVSLMPTGLLSRILLGAHDTSALRSAFRQAMAQVKPAALRARLGAVLSVDVSAKYSTLTIPTLYLRARSDRVVPPIAGELVSRLNAHTEMVEIEGPHFLLQAAPIEAARAVGAFAREANR